MGARGGPAVLEGMGRESDAYGSVHGLWLEDEERFYLIGDLDQKPGFEEESLVF